MSKKVKSAKEAEIQDALRGLELKLIESRSLVSRLVTIFRSQSPEENQKAFDLFSKKRNELRKEKFSTCDLDYLVFLLANLVIKARERK